MAEYKITWDSTFTIDQHLIHAQATKIIQEIIEKEIASKYTDVGKAVASAVRDVVYSHKEEIIARVIERASREIVRKALPTFLERYENESKT